MNILAAVLLWSWSCVVHGWGFVGHRLTAQIAEALLDRRAASAIKQLLGNGQSLVDVSTWADEIKRRPEYRFTSRLHYVNPEDDEPAQCSYSYKRDCPKGDQCIVGALFNYSRRMDIKNSNRYTPAERAEALKFVTHFVADLHQPLHVSGRLRGGNGADVRFLGVKTNLHSLWDSLLVQKRISDDFGGSQRKFFQYLLDRYEREWKPSDAESWTRCRRGLDSDALVVQDAQPTHAFQIQSWLDIGLSWRWWTTREPDAQPTCFNKWTAEVNRLNCEVVWTGWSLNVDLGVDYYRNAIEVVELALVKGGVRLATFLNELVA